MSSRRDNELEYLDLVCCWQVSAPYKKLLVSCDLVLVDLLCLLFLKLNAIIYSVYVSKSSITSSIFFCLLIWNQVFIFDNQGTTKTMLNVMNRTGYEFDTNDKMMI